MSNREEIIQKAENFNYTKYLYSCMPDFGINCYIDSDLIHLLKNRIKKDIGLKALFWPSYKHSLHYYFLAENHSQLYLTYNNHTIFSVKDQNNQSIFTRDDYIYYDGFAWYLNFTQIPYAHADTSIELLNDFILIEMDLEYRWYCGYVCYHSHSFEQYLLLDDNLDAAIILVFYSIFID
ncbi:MAG: hypothetical protein ACFFCI_06980 [Promethearchaeota archaeon]